MDKVSRLNELLEVLSQAQRLSVEEAAMQLGVSQATIRRDYDELARQQMLVRTRGGAMISRITYELPLRYKAASRADQKRRIGQAAAALLPIDAVVGINGGTTTTEVARAIADRTGAVIDGDGQPGPTIVTNAVNIAHELIIRPNIKVVLTGGVARTRSYEMVGPLAALVLRELSLDVAILGVDGISPQHGATAKNEQEASVNSLLVERATSVIVVADSTKLSVQSFARICSLQSISSIVTDSDASDEMIADFELANVKVIRA